MVRRLRSLTGWVGCIAWIALGHSARAEEPETEIKAYCHTRALARDEKDRSPAEAACRTLMRGAIDAFNARLIPEGMEQLRLLDEALAYKQPPKRPAKKPYSDLGDPFDSRSKPPRPSRPVSKPSSAGKGDLTTPF